MQKELLEILAQDPRRLDDEDRGFLLEAADMARDLASSHFAIGAVLTDLDRRDEALVEHGEVIKRLEVLVRDHPGRPISRASWRWP